VILKEENMHLIGVASQAQHGKDTLANHLAQVLNKTMGREFWKRDAFANNVKRIYCETFNKDMDFVEKWKVIPEVPPGMDMTVRRALQFIGDGFRQIQGNIWIELMYRNDSPKIISDIRYINELKSIKDRGGFTILMVRPDKINNDPNGSEAQIKPLLEFALGRGEWAGTRNQPEGMQYVDAIIINNGTVEELFAQADNLVPQLLNYFELQAQ
jgi:ribosomal protein S8